jgi:hypothetical protein
MSPLPFTAATPPWSIGIPTPIGIPIPVRDGIWERIVMRKRAKLMVLMALGVLLATSGCAGGYQGGYYTPEPYGYSKPQSISDVPPSFYNYDPTLRDWYTAPYWNLEKP